jgi:hypothetical protein
LGTPIKQLVRNGPDGSQLNHLQRAGNSLGTREEGLKAIGKAVRKALKSGISGGLVDQTVATSIHAATVKAAKRAAAPKKEAVKTEKPFSPKKVAKVAKRTEQEVD